MAGTFSESWYRVSNVRAALRPSVTFRKTRYQGEEWYVMSDPYTGSYFRLSPAYYEFVAQLSFDLTIEELWIKTLEENPQAAPGQQDIITLLSELNSSNLIFFQDAGDSSKMFERQWKKQRQKQRKQIMNFLFIRLPLGNPNRLLERFKTVWRWIFNRGGFLVWLAVVLFGIKTAIENADLFAHEGANVLAPDNLILLYLSMAFIKTFHEWGHAAICKRYEGEVTAWGVMFVLFTPLPFVDTTSAWVLRNKWQRILVSSGGMIVELFIGAIACVIWAHSPPGVIHSVAYNMMFTATVSTLLFNANPLMRFDGYYILSDLIEIPNLQQKSKDQVNYLFQKYLFGVKDAKEVTTSRKEAGWLAVYGVGSMVYRVFLLGGIILFIADSYFILGIILAVVMGTMWLVAPIFKFFKFIHTSPKLRRVRLRALMTSYGGLFGVIGLLLLLPYERSIEAVGVVEGQHVQELTTQSAGQIQALHVSSNSMVRKGDEIITLGNPLLAFELAKVERELNQNAIMTQQVLSRRGLEREPVLKNKESLLQLKEKLLAKQAALVIRAPNDGRWIFDDANVLNGQWVSQGQNLGQVVDEQTMRFSAVITQEDASDLFDLTLDKGVVRMKGQGDVDIETQKVTLHPHAQEQLPSSALGWQGGGSIATKQGDAEGLATTEPFYLVNAALSPSGKVFIGQTGRIKIELPSQTLGFVVLRNVQQFLQKRYQL